MEKVGPGRKWDLEERTLSMQENLRSKRVMACSGNQVGSGNGLKPRVELMWLDGHFSGAFSPVFLFALGFHYRRKLAAWPGSC